MARKWTGVRALAYRHARAHGATKLQAYAFGVFYEGAVYGNPARMREITLAACWGEFSYTNRIVKERRRVRV